MSDPIHPRDLKIKIFADAADLAAQIAADLQPDDMIVCLGAGDITKWAAGLAAAISAKSKETA